MSRWAGVSTALPAGLPDLRAVHLAGAKDPDLVERRVAEARRERLFQESDRNFAEAMRLRARLDEEAARSERERRFRNGEQLFP